MKCTNGERKKKRILLCLIHLHKLSPVACDGMSYRHYRYSAVYAIRKQKKGGWYVTLCIHSAIIQTEEFLFDNYLHFNEAHFNARVGEGNTIIYEFLFLAGNSNKCTMQKSQRMAAFFCLPYIMVMPPSAGKTRRRRVRESERTTNQSDDDDITLFSSCVISRALFIST